MRSSTSHSLVVSGLLTGRRPERALVLSRGDPTVFVTRPLSLGLLAVALLLLVVVIFPAVRKTRAQAFQDESN